MPRFSIVVPFHNEEENVTLLYARLKQTMEQAEGSFELIFVDDGSTDRTFMLLEEIAAVDSRVLVIRLRRNFGQTCALAAGFDHAAGEFVMAMDGDLQHDPADIPRFIEKLDEGYDLVSGWRKDRIESGDNFWLRRLPSHIANKMMSALSGVNIHDFGTTFKAYRRELIQSIPLYGQMHRFIPALASSVGSTICEVPIHCGNRQYGKSHYGISRTFGVFFDLLTIRFLLKHMNRPMHFFGGLGMTSILAGGAMSLWMAALKLMHPPISLMMTHGPIFVIAAILMIAGVQLLTIGLLGELLVRHYYTTQDRAPYTIQTLIRSHSSEMPMMLSDE